MWHMLHCIMQHMVAIAGRRGRNGRGGEEGEGKGEEGKRGRGRMILACWLYRDRHTDSAGRVEPKSASGARYKMLELSIMLVTPFCHKTAFWSIECLAHLSVSLTA